jgi:hypothetical protein
MLQQSGVTRLGEFSPNGSMLIFGSFFNAEVAQILVVLFYREKSYV